MYKREPLPNYGGLVSFFRTPGIELHEATEGLAVVAGVPIDNGIPVARVGARFGPRAIREESLTGPVHYLLTPERTMFDVATGRGLRLKEELGVVDAGDFNFYPTDLAKTTDSVIAGMTELVKRGAFPVVLGGDHYVTYPSFTGFAKGIAERKSGARIGYIHIDSHSDFEDSFGTGSSGRYNHGTMVRRISENPMVSFKNLAWVGLNTPLDLGQERLRKAHNLKMMTYLDNRERGIEQVMKEAMEVASDGTDMVYVSVDIDVIDASESPGTGAPEFRGISSRDFLQVMGMLSRYKDLSGLDLCEVAPNWDHSGRTVKLATRGLISLLSPRLFDEVELPE